MRALGAIRKLVKIANAVIKLGPPVMEVMEDFKKDDQVKPAKSEKGK